MICVGRALRSEYGDRGVRAWARPNREARITACGYDERRGDGRPRLSGIDGGQDYSPNGRDEVLFVGTPDGLEARLVPEAGVAFQRFAAKGFDRPALDARDVQIRLAGSRSGACVCCGSGHRRRRRIWRVRFTPGRAGGGPHPNAAVLCTSRTPFPGLANQVLSRWARAVGVTYEESPPHLRSPIARRVTGNPVRRSMLRRRTGTRAPDARRAADATGPAGLWRESGARSTSTRPCWRGVTALLRIAGCGWCTSPGGDARSV